MSNVGVKFQKNSRGCVLLYSVVGPGMESCSAGKDGKEAIVVNNSD